MGPSGVYVKVKLNITRHFDYHDIFRIVPLSAAMRNHKTNYSVSLWCFSLRPGSWMRSSMEAGRATPPGSTLATLLLGTPMFGESVPIATLPETRGGLINIRLFHIHIFRNDCIWRNRRIVNLSYPSILPASSYFQIDSSRWTKGPSQALLQPRHTDSFSGTN